MCEVDGRSLYVRARAGCGVLGGEDVLALEEEERLGLEGRFCVGPPPWWGSRPGWTSRRVAIATFHLA